MNGRPRDLRSLRLVQKSKVFVIIRPIVVARGQILDNLTILHERRDLMWVALCIDGNKYVKSAKPITNITYSFGLCGRFQNKRGRLALRRRPDVKLITCGWVGIAQENTEIDKLFLLYFFLSFVWYSRIQRQTSGMKWLSRQLLWRLNGLGWPERVECASPRASWTKVAAWYEETDWTTVYAVDEGWQLIEGEAGDGNSAKSCCVTAVVTGRNQCWDKISSVASPTI